MNKDFSLKTIRGNILNITADGLENINSGTCLIFVHGFKGFKDWGFFPYVSKYFSEKGFFVLTFNFSHNGIGLDKNEFSEMDKFAQNTVSLEIAELNDLINAYYDGFFGKDISGKVVLIGHSRGGAVSLLSSLLNQNPVAYIIWASVAYLDRYTERQKIEWRNKGFVEITNSRTNQIMRLGLELLDDVDKNKESSLNIERAVKNLGKPLLIVHGEEDLTVPISEADTIFNWSNKEKSELVKIMNIGHTFGIVHPFDGSTNAFDTVVKETERFISEIFKN